MLILMNVFSWQDTGIGKTVNSYRKHYYETVANSARHLVAKWKQLVQLKTEAINDTHSVPATQADAPVTAGVEETVSAGNCIGKVVGKHSSKHKHLHTSGINAASKRHSSSRNKHTSHKQGGDEVISSRPCSQSKDSGTSVTLECGDDSNSSQNLGAGQSSAFINAFNEHQKLLVDDINKVAVSGHKSRHEKHSRLKNFSAGEKNKETYHSRCKVSAITERSTLHKTKGHTAATESVRNGVGCFASEMLLCENGKEISDCRGDTNEHKSSRKSFSKGRHTNVDKGPLEKKSSDKHRASNAIVPSSTETHGFSSVLVDNDQTDVSTSPAADDVDEDECNGMTFEQMLNYDNAVIVARKKKGRVLTGDKRRKSASHRQSNLSVAVTKEAGKPDSRHTSSLRQTAHSNRSAESDELEGAQLHRQPVVPHPDNQVGTGI